MRSIGPVVDRINAWTDAGATSSRCSSPSSSSGSASGRCCRSCRSTSPSTASTSRLLGVVVAAWPAARLDRRADLRLAGRPRRARVPLMVVGLLAAGVFSSCRSCSSARCRSSSCAPVPASRPRSTTRRRAATSPTRHRPSAAARRSGCTARPRWAGCCSGRRSARSGRVVASAGSRSSSCSAAWQLVARRDPDPVCAGATTGRRTHPAPSADATEFPPDAPSTARRAAADFDADRGPAGEDHRAAPTRLLEPRPHRGPRHHARRLLRGRHVRGHLEPVPPASRRRPRRSSA